MVSIRAQSEYHTSRQVDSSTGGRSTASSSAIGSKYTRGARYSHEEDRSLVNMEELFNKFRTGKTLWRPIRELRTFYTGAMHFIFGNFNIEAVTTR